LDTRISFVPLGGLGWSLQEVTTQSYLTSVITIYIITLNEFLELFNNFIACDNAITTTVTIASSGVTNATLRGRGEDKRGTASA